MKNKIYLIGEINDESFLEFSERLTELEKNPNALIEIEMNSHGGHAMDALAFYGRIIRSKNTIYVTAFGQVSSAAVLVFAACDHRRMAREAWMMVHEDEDSVENVKTADFEKKSRNMRRLEDQWNYLLEHSTVTKKEVWAQLHKDETYLNPLECKKLGIVDEIV